MRTRLIQALSLPPIYAYNLGLAGAGLVVEDGCDPSDWGEYYTSAQQLVRFLQRDGVDGLVDAFSDTARAPPAAAPPAASAAARYGFGSAPARDDAPLATPALERLPAPMVAFLGANRRMAQKHMARFLSKRANRRLFSLVCVGAARRGAARAAPDISRRSR